MAQVGRGPPRHPALVHRQLGLGGIAVEEDEELDRRLAVAEQTQAMEVIVELEAGPEGGEEEDDGEDGGEPGEGAVCEHSLQASRSTGVLRLCGASRAIGNGLGSHRLKLNHAMALCLTDLVRSTVTSSVSHVVHSAMPRRGPILAYTAFLAILVYLSAADAAQRELSLELSSLELPGAPATVVSADVNGDGLRDLAVVIAFTRWGELGIEESVEMDQVRGLVEVMTVIPALMDHRELWVFLGRADGGFDPTARAR